MVTAVLLQAAHPPSGSSSPLGSAILGCAERADPTHYGMQDVELLDDAYRENPSPYPTLYMPPCCSSPELELVDSYPEVVQTCQQEGGGSKPPSSPAMPAPSSVGNTVVRSSCCRGCCGCCCCCGARDISSCCSSGPCPSSSSSSSCRGLTTFETVLCSVVFVLVVVVQILALVILF